MATQYIKLDQRTHVLKRPGMYIGSIVADEEMLWVYDSKSEMIVQKNIKYVPGLYKIFDEIVVNALDQVKRLKHRDETQKQVKEIKVYIDQSTGKISVYNDGDGIAVNFNEKHGMYDPELIFGNMLTSSNYVDNDKLNIGGQNGIGSKACNIFSKSFELETVDPKKKKLYKQIWKDNMTTKTDPVIEKYTKYPYTKLSFLPDYEKFGLNELTDDIAALFKKRVHDICALTSANIKVYLNDELINIKGFEKYVEMYNFEEDKPAFDSNDKWHVGAMFSNNGFQHMSFVNGICTQKGGKHVEYVTTSIAKKLSELIVKRRKANVKPVHIRDNLFIFVNASSVDGATFDSQTKDTLTTPSSKFGSKWSPDAKFIEKLYKSKITENAINLSSVNENKQAQKTDGKQRKTLRIPKLDDANWAGTAKSRECALILTEGDSAKSMAISGLSVVGRDKFGVFPLKGKVLNVKDASSTKINENKEIADLKKIIGLESGKTYSNVNSLRYGKIILMCDQDVDGSHIKSLIFNMFHTLWPSLLKQENFLTSILTPIVKVTKGKQERSFYTLTEFEDWKKATPSAAQYKSKYFKGLGTSTSQEAKEYFKSMITANYCFGDHTDEKLELAFNKSMADSRKEWIGKYDKNSIIDCLTQKNVKFEEFIDKELIHYSVYNLERSIPHVLDGLKTSIRKILYCCFKKKLFNEIKVAQLAGYVSENGAYHHGEASLQESIVGMAQDYVGSNNINLLLPKGQFGSRLLGGKDSASPRYIYTELNPIVKFIFPEDDMKVLNYLEDDGITIEPDHYMPIIPILLVNGAKGIATGYSTSIPAFSPKDIIQNIKRMLNGDEPVRMTPYFKGFTGMVTQEKTSGKYQRVSPLKIEITELPVGTWTNDYKAFLDSFIESNPKILKDYEAHYTETLVRFILVFQTKNIVDQLLAHDVDGTPNFETEFKMHSTKPVSMSNMHAFDRYGKIKKYNSEVEILKEFFEVRMDFYAKRKAKKLAELQEQIENIDARMKFILSVIQGEIHIMNRKNDEIEQQLILLNLKKKNNSFDYLIKLPINSLTLEKKNELLDQYNEKDAEYAKLKEMSTEELYESDLKALVV